MVRSSLTEEKIVAAAVAIAINGDMPTIASVRRYVGGRGSETTILTYLQKWKGNLLKHALTTQALALNPGQLENLQIENSKLRAQNNDLKLAYNKLQTEFHQLMIYLGDHEALIKAKAQNLNLREKIALIKAELKDMAKHIV